MTKPLVSLGIVFHLLVISLYPNGVSYLRNDLLPIFHPYANTFGLNSKWQFFAPEPESATYLEYEVDLNDQAADIMGADVKTWPPAKTSFFDFHYTRRGASRSFLVHDPQYMESIFIHWVCRTKKGAAGVSVRPAYVRIATLNEVQEGRPLFDPSSIHYEATITASCSEVLNNGE